MPTSTIPFGAILELIIVVGVVLGLLLLVIALLIALGDGRWLPVEAELVENRLGAALRWTVGGIAYRRSITVEERDALRAAAEEREAEARATEAVSDNRAGDEARGHLPGTQHRHHVFYSAGHPQRLRWQHPRPALAALRLCGYLFLGIAAVATAVSFIEMALQG